MDRPRDNPNQSAGPATLQGIFLVAGGHTFSVVLAMGMGHPPTMGAPLAPTAPGGKTLWAQKGGRHASAAVALFLAWQGPEGG